MTDEENKEPEEEMDLDNKDEPKAEEEEGK